MKKDCPCPKKNCQRHGNCDDCINFHGTEGKLPFCERPKFSIVGLAKKYLKIP